MQQPIHELRIKVARNQDEAGISVSAWPSIEFHRWVKQMLHSLHDDWTALDIHNRFDAQQIGANAL